MRFSLTSLIRLISMLTLVSTLLAIGLSKVVPVEKGEHRALVEPRLVSVNGSVFNPPTCQNFMLDRETGRLCRSRLQTRETALDYASFAPWKGKNGQVEVVGRYTSRTASEHGQILVSVGVARLDFSTGHMLETSMIDPVVTGTPCWLPGSSRRVVFPAGGDLYLQEFSDGIDEPSNPRRIDARTAFAGSKRIVFNDVLCPAIPELEGRLLVSVSLDGETQMPNRLRPSQIWSIQLDRTGLEVISAAQVVDDPDHQGAELLPNVVKTSDGRIVLAYLKRESLQGPWSLQLGCVAFDPVKRTPHVARETLAKINERCAVSRPEFSLNGEFVYRIKQAQHYSEMLDRIPVLEALTAGSGLAANEETKVASLTPGR